jgi:hypothetical protein
MIYAYRLRDQKSDEKGRVVEGFTIRQTWQFTSDPKAASLERWKSVSVLKAQDISSAKKAVDVFDKEQEASVQTDQLESDSQPADLEDFAGLSADPLAKELEGKSLAELKEYAKFHGFDEAEYSKLTRSKMIEYIVLGMRNKENA